MTVFGGNVLGKSVMVPGLGEFGYFSVGSILHSRGIEHFFQPEGAASRIDGSVRFSAYVDPDGDLKWKFDHAEGPHSRKRAYDAPPLTEETQIDFPSDVAAEMRRLTETLHERQPGLWYHQAVSAIDIELKEFEKAEAEHVRFIRIFTGLLANPELPKSHFDEAPPGSHSVGTFRPATDAEREESREFWRKGIAEREDTLTKLRADTADRIALLTRLREAMNKWSRTKAGRDSGADPIDFYREAIPASAPLQEMPMNKYLIEYGSDNQLATFEASAPEGAIKECLEWLDGEAGPDPINSVSLCIQINLSDAELAGGAEQRLMTETFVG